MSDVPILLASASPRRQAFLRGVGIPFEVVVPEIDETPRPGEPPYDTVRRLAEAKARAAHERRPRGEGLILAADTEVVLDGVTLGKPDGPDEAVTMLRRLSGREHLVVTGFCILDQRTGEAERAVADTRVQFRGLDDHEIEGYVSTGEPLDKAGAYACQGIGSFLIARVEGSYTNVVGLPLGQVIETLGRLGGPRPFTIGSRR